MDWEAMALVGRIARAHGIRGQVIVNPETDFPDERFRPGDIGRPWPVAWTSEVFAHDVEGRSLTTFWW